MHIEIKYIDDRRELNVFYKGFEVYREVGGDLEKYVPKNEWEEKIDYFFGVAKKIEKTRRKNTENAVKDIAIRKHAEYLEDIRSRWGLE